MNAAPGVVVRSVHSATTVLVLYLAAGASPAWADSGGAEKSVPATPAMGEGIYKSICQGCHMPDARGASGAGKYPALAGDPALVSADFMAITLLQGRRNMPAFGGVRDADPFFMAPPLSDEQIASVVNYVRTHFGNHFQGTITASRVKALRESLPQR